MGGNRDNVVGEFKQFDVTWDYSDHFYAGNSGKLDSYQQKSLMGERRILEEQLPPSVFVRVYENRVDLIRAAIVGAAGTPYHDGLFFFDIAFNIDHPINPPQVKYHSFGLPIQLNPNVDSSGVVCPRLLRSAVYSASKSTILQVLVCLQGLVVNEKPFYGHRLPSGPFTERVATEDDSLMANASIFWLSCKIMELMIKQPPKGFESLVATHFKERANTVLAACYQYLNNQVPVGYYNIPGAGAAYSPSSSYDSVLDACTIYPSCLFKPVVTTVIRPQLVEAFRQCGAQVDRNLVDDFTAATEAETPFGRFMAGLAMFLDCVCCSSLRWWNRSWI